MSTYSFTQGNQSSSQKDKIISKTTRIKRRTTRRKAQEEGKKLWICSFCSGPQEKRKRYMSYPALYTHVRQKHKGQEIHCPKNDQCSNTQPPIQKMRSILKNVKFLKREQFERSLIDQITMIKLEIVQEFINTNKIDKTLIGDRNTDTAVREVQLEAKIMGNQMGIDDRVLSDMENKNIFKEYYGKISMISFGGDIVRFFSRNREIAVRLQLQMVLLDSIDTHLIDYQQFYNYSMTLWDSREYLISLFEDEWSNWKAVDKSILLEDYPELNVDPQHIMMKIN